MTSSDARSPLAKEIINAGSYAALVAPAATADKARVILAKVTPDQLLTVPVKSYPHAYAMLAGLWLWHDALHECHEIAQKSPGDLQRSKPPDKVQSRDAIVSLAFWHAIMHRREGDFWNSKYWYARCRDHPALATIASHARPLLDTLADRPLASRLARGGWDTDAFVDWVEEVSAGAEGSNRDLAVKLQQIEWHALFDHCTREAARQ